jgi:hypothetical protein
VDEEADDE